MNLAFSEMFKHFQTNS